MIQYPCVSLNHTASISDIFCAILCYITFGLSGPVVFLYISCKRHAFRVEQTYFTENAIFDLPHKFT